MIRPIWISPRAEQDIVQLATYIGRDSGDAANRFLDAVDQLFDRIAQSPKIGQVFGVPNPRLAGMRASRVIGFLNHLAFYLPNDSGIQIVRVLHGSRDLDAIFE